MKHYKVLTELDRNRWHDFVHSHPQGNIFQSPELYDVYNKAKNHEPIFLAVVDDKQTVVATLLGVIQRQYRGLLGQVSARSIVVGGPLVKDHDKKALETILAKYQALNTRST